MRAQKPARASKTRGIRIPTRLDAEIAREARSRGKSWSAATSELLEEAIRTRRCPGILFADGPAGRRAVVAGSGIDVWEIVRTWQETGKSYRKLQRNYPWLSDPQLRSALAYYELYPEEIQARLERERQWTPERARRELPFSVPRPPR